MGEGLVWVNVGRPIRRGKEADTAADTAALRPRLPRAQPAGLVTCRTLGKANDPIRELLGDVEYIGERRDREAAGVRQALQGERLQQLAIGRDGEHRALRRLERRLAQRARVAEEGVAKSIHHDARRPLERLSLVLPHKLSELAVGAPPQDGLVRQIADVQRAVQIDAERRWGARRVG